MTISIYASQLAACIGFNKFKSVEESAVEVFSRTAPDVYNNAIQRNNQKTKANIEQTLADLELTERITGLVKYDDRTDTHFTQDLDKIILELADKVEPEILKDVTSYVFTERGKRAEQSSLDTFEKEMKKIVNNRNDKFHKKYIDYVVDDSTKTFLLGGKVDGITDDNELVEVKNRQYKLFPRIPVYEKIQIHTYMYLTGIKKCNYVQCYRDQSSTETIKFDTEFFNDVMEKLKKFVIAIDKLLKDKKLQDDLIMDKKFVI